jgi:hypothetical protein
LSGRAPRRRDSNRESLVAIEPIVCEFLICCALELDLFILYIAWLLFTFPFRVESGMHSGISFNSGIELLQVYC